MVGIARSENSYGKIGREVGFVGRWCRLIGGGALTGYVVLQAARTGSAGDVAELALYFAATLGAYTAAEYFLGKRVLSKANPWLGTAILLGPLAIIFALQLGPQVFHHALVLYFGVSLIFSFFARYGGCEVMSIPGLLFGSRHTVYCPLSVIDVVEKAALDRRTPTQAPRQAFR